MAHLPRRAESASIDSLSSWYTILYIICYILTNHCQVEKILFYGWVFGLFGKLPILGRFVPQVITPIHAAPRLTKRPRILMNANSPPGGKISLHSCISDARTEAHALRLNSRSSRGDTVSRQIDGRSRRLPPPVERAPSVGNPIPP